MKKVFEITDVILNSPYTNMFLAVVFLYTSFNSIIDDYHSGIKGIHVHHGIALYALLMFLKSLIAALQAISKMKEANDEIKIKGMGLKEKINK